MTGQDYIDFLEHELEELGVLVAEQTARYNRKEAEMLKIRRVSYYLMVYQEQRRMLLDKTKQELPLVDSNGT